MARLELISVDDTIIGNLLEAFRDYASVPDDYPEEMFHRLLRNAALRVQQYADRAFMPTVVRVTLPIPEASGIVRLYMGGGDIQECKDERGNDIPFDVLTGGRLQLFRRGGTATVKYATAPNEVDQDALSQAVIRYATADYDGADTAELNRILTEAVL